MCDELLKLVKGDTPEERKHNLDVWLYRQWPEEKSVKLVCAIAMLGRCSPAVLAEAFGGGSA
jgi:hypothetical protein